MAICRNSLDTITCGWKIFLFWWTYLQKCEKFLKTWHSMANYHLFTLLTIWQWHSTLEDICSFVKEQLLRNTAICIIFSKADGVKIIMNIWIMLCRTLRSVICGRAYLWVVTASWRLRCMHAVPKAAMCIYESPLGARSSMQQFLKR